MKTSKLSKSKLARALAIILCFLMCFTLIPWMNNESAIADAAATIEIGDYVQMGTYYGEPILWRCVAFYMVDEDGNVYLGDTKDQYEEGYLPLMLSDKILCLKAFDASGSNTDNSSSHGRGYDYDNTNPDDPDYSVGRQFYGSNYWEDSNIKCWLNSTASKEEVSWSCGNEPDEDNVSFGLGYNHYEEEAGFLSNFTQKEIGCMKTVTQAQLLDQYEYADMENFGSEAHTYSDKISDNVLDCVANFNQAYKTTTTDTMFLLDVNQVSEVYNNEDILGENYYFGEATDECLDNSDYTIEGEELYYWLRSPEMQGQDSTMVRIIESGREGAVGSCMASEGMGGVRPAFYLDMPASGFASGDGDENKPFIIEASANVKIAEGIEHGTITVSNEKATAGDTIEVTVSPDKGYELEKITVFDKDGTDITEQVLDDNTITIPEAGKLPITVSATFSESKFTLADIVLSGIATITGIIIVKTILKSQTIKPIFSVFNKWCLKYNIFNYICKIIF